MAEELHVDGASTREERYKSLLPQLEALVRDEQDLIANMANAAAALRQTFGFFWVGFYIIKNNELVLGPFQGTIACTRIGFGKGVCGSAWKEGRTLVVPDVDAFPGHIACSSASKSEIVVPGIVKGEVKWVLDVDSDQLNDFGDIDALYLREVSAILERSYLSAAAQSPTAFA